MEPLTVSYHKLRQYVKDVGMYRMYEEGEDIRLIFEPTFVEATYHGDATRIYIQGKRSGERVTINKFEIEDEHGMKRQLDLMSARDPLLIWLESIED